MVSSRTTGSCCPSTFEHELHLPGEELTGVVRRISLMAQKNAPLRLSFREGELTVSAQTPDVGEASEPLPVPFARRAVRDRVQPGVPARRPGVDRVRRRRPQAHLPAAARAARGRRRQRVPLPDHAHPPERLRPPAGPWSSPVSASATSAPTPAADVALGERLTVVHGPNGAGKTNLLEALYFGCTGRSCRTDERARGRALRRRRRPRVEVDLHDEDGAPRPERRLPARRAASASRPTARRSSACSTRPPGRSSASSCPTAWSSSRARRPCAARTSTRSSPACGRRAAGPAARTRRRSPSATRCSSACARAPPAATRCAPGTSSSARHALALRDDRARAVALLAARLRRVARGPRPRRRRRSCATGRGRAPRRPRSSPTSWPSGCATDLERGFTGPRARTATTSRCCATGASCARTGRRASSAWRSWRCCWPSATRSPPSAVRPPLLLLDDVMSELDAEPPRAPRSRASTRAGQALVTTTDLGHVPGGRAADAVRLRVDGGAVEPSPSPRRPRDAAPARSAAGRRRGPGAGRRARAARPCWPTSSGSGRRPSATLVAAHATPTAERGGTPHRDLRERGLGPGARPHGARPRGPAERRARAPTPSGALRCQAVARESLGVAEG